MSAPEAAISLADDAPGRTGSATASEPYAPHGFGKWLEAAGAGLLAALWIAPLLFACWAAFHPVDYTTRFDLAAPLTLDNFARAWRAAPFARYFLNTALLVTMIFICQAVLGTLAAYAFARFEFPGRGVAFALVLAQLMIMPDVLIVENYRTIVSTHEQDESHEITFAL